MNTELPTYRRDEDARHGCHCKPRVHQLRLLVPAALSGLGAADIIEPTFKSACSPFEGLRITPKAQGVKAKVSRHAAGPGYTGFK